MGFLIILQISTDKRLENVIFIFFKPIQILHTLSNEKYLQYLSLFPYFLPQTSSGEEADTACGWGVKLSHARCELAGVSDEPSDAFLQPWRCAAALPGRIVTPPLHHQVCLNIVIFFNIITRKGSINKDNKHLKLMQLERNGECCNPSVTFFCVVRIE